LTDAIQSGELLVESVSSEGVVTWEPILHVERTSVPWESMVKIMTPHGADVMTAGHRVFTSPTDKVEAGSLSVADTVLGILTGGVRGVQILSTETSPSVEYVYDLTVGENHNFVLHNSRMVVSNSPDRNYRFMPPAHEGDVGAYNRVFGYVWEDYELLEYMRAGLDWWNSFPPETEYLRTIDLLVSQKGTWKTSVMWAAIVHAMFALTLNWSHERFSYSIGGISLDIDKASGYESLKNNAESQLDKATEAKMQTTKIIAGLKQPRFGIGVRSSFGPPTGRGTLGPRSYVG